MSMDRRGFFKLAGLTALAAELPVLGAARRGGPEAPGEAPLEGSRWAMVIDLPKCHEHPECTRCIDACNRAHNVPKIPDPRHEIKWIWKEPFGDAFPTQESHYLPQALAGKPVLLLCNHCDNPPCVRVCPTQATWKREEDGVVMMDWHRCIGCRYCIAACPYGSRSFNWVDPRPYLGELNPDFPTRTKGVVEKCDLCEERLAEGKVPACVEACPCGALHFGDLGDPASSVRKLLEERFAIRRKPGLGTEPQVYYLV
ncbi:MAG TPA: 4Fe-4S dicluster domain-containing protein [Acidobacteria bacterium]|nr:4Fe-4S dicluster domain-containing protein [Acidobacteriota bacterium]